MNPLSRLRFKIVTSFAIAALGTVMLVRLMSLMPFSFTSLLSFLVPVLLIIAGIWRGLIFLHAVRGFAKS